MKTDTKIIGVAGGVGPYAGIDLVRKIFDDTIADKDQDHLPVCLISAPSIINDRSAFLMGESDINPAFAIAKVLMRLESIGANVAGIPCNTAHAPVIIDTVREELRKNGSKIKLLNMIEEVADFIIDHEMELKNIAVMSTNGLFQTNLYPSALKARGLDVLLPEREIQEMVHDSIYNPEYGIKARSYPVEPKAREILLNTIAAYKEQGADAVILGCTELPLAVPENEIDGLVMVDATRILARSLIREVAEDKLKPL